MDTKLFVGNLSYDTSEDELRELFSRAGTIAAITLIKDRDTGRSKGFGFIEMSSQNEAEEAIKMFNGTQFGNREIKVDKAKPPEVKSTYPGGNQRYDKGGDWNRKRAAGKKSRRYE
jgi:cold-inducible RNA-binding protein